MTRRARVAFFILTACFLTAGIGGCKRFYRITDLETGDVYYAKRINKHVEPFTGILRFEDEVTGANISLEEYEMQKILKRKWRREVARER